MPFLTGYEIHVPDSNNQYLRRIGIGHYYGSLGTLAAATPGAKNLKGVARCRAQTVATAGMSRQLAGAANGSSTLSGNVSTGHMEVDGYGYAKVTMPRCAIFGGGGGIASTPTITWSNWYMGTSSYYNHQCVGVQQDTGYAMWVNADTSSITVYGATPTNQYATSGSIATGGTDYSTSIGGTYTFPDEFSGADYFITAMFGGGTVSQLILRFWHAGVISGAAYPMLDASHNSVRGALTNTSQYWGAVHRSSANDVHVFFSSTYTSKGTTYQAVSVAYSTTFGTYTAAQLVQVPITGVANTVLGMAVIRAHPTDLTKVYLLVTHSGYYQTLYWYDCTTHTMGLIRQTTLTGSNIQLQVNNCLIPHSGSMSGTLIPLSWNATGENTTWRFYALAYDVTSATAWKTPTVTDATRTWTTPSGHQTASAGSAVYRQLSSTNTVHLQLQVMDTSYKMHAYDVDLADLSASGSYTILGYSATVPGATDPPSSAGLTPSNSRLHQESDTNAYLVTCYNGGYRHHFAWNYWTSQWAPWVYLDATLAASASASASLNVASVAQSVNIAGTMPATALSSLNLYIGTRHNLAGTLGAISSLTASLNLGANQYLAGTAYAVSSASMQLKAGGISVAGSALCSSSVQLLDLHYAVQQLQGSAPCRASTYVALSRTALVQLAASIQTMASSLVALQLAKPLAGSAPEQVTASGGLSVVLTIAGAVQAKASAVATLHGDHQLAGSALCRASASCWMRAVTPFKEGIAVALDDESVYTSVDQEDIWTSISVDSHQ